MTADKRLTGMLDELGRVSDERGKLTRTFLSPAMKRANALVGAWMKEAGLSVRIDSVGNLIGRIEGAGKNARTLLLGSHLDTVRDAGRFDGPLGVLLPIVSLGELKRRGITLPFAVEVIGFSEEEGVRFASAYLGSEGYTGRLKAKTLAIRDDAGVSVGEALREFGGGKFTLPKAAHRRGDLLGCVEVHIEQGPVLERKKSRLAWCRLSRDRVASSSRGRARPDTRAQRRWTCAAMRSRARPSLSLALRRSRDARRDWSPRLVRSRSRRVRRM